MLNAAYAKYALAWTLPLPQLDLVAVVESTNS
jgi:hypothetical protein